MPRIGVTTEDMMRRLIELERLVGGWPANDRAHRRRHITAPAASIVELKIAKLDGDLASSGSATASIWTANAGTETDSGDNETCYDWMIPSGKELVTASKVVLGKIDGYWYVLSSGTCPSTP